MTKKVPNLMTVANFKKVTGISITEKHKGKMSGMMSLSTSCIGNEYCKRYAEDGDKICSHCYAQTQMKRYKNMHPCYERNADVLCGRVLSKEEMPLLNTAFFRFESFGDLRNETQVINYFNICKANKHVKFALWTKNPFLIQRAIDNGAKKPSNLQIVLSSHYLNKPMDITPLSFADKVFTVYDKNFIKENDVDINCGARSCLTCQKCYKKSKTVYINEKLK